MSNVYYGVCRTAADASVKVVQFLPTAEIETVSALEIGDLFAVYFDFQNTADSITITTDEDLSSDAGLTVKTIGEQEQCANLWKNGEAVIFVCTSINRNSEVAPSEQEADNNPQDYVYLRLLNNGPASVDVSGIMKLLTKEPIVDVGTYLAAHENDEAAVAPWILKELYDLIGTQADVTYAVDIREPQVSDTWYPNIQLGILTVNGTDDYQILAPPQTVYTRTSQFENDGPPDRDKPSKPDWDEDNRGSTYITSSLSTPLFFTNGRPAENDGIPVYLYKQGENADYPIIGNDVVNSESITKVFGDTIQLGDYVTVNNDSQSPTISLRTTNIGGDASITGGLTVGSDISEAGTLLKNKYSGKLSVTPHLFQYNSKDYLTLNSSQSFTDPHPTCTFTRPGYRCLGIVGHNYNLQNNTKDAKADASYVREWELFPISFDDLNSSVTIQMDITNASTTKQINVKLYVYLLWEKKID